MILRQFLHSEPVVAISYLVGCGGKSACVIIDPVDPPEHYRRAAAELGMEIRYVVDTHVHADHRSTGRPLAAATGAPYLLHESVEATFDFTPVGDGARFAIGNVQLEVLHLPGHTSEHIGLLDRPASRNRALARRHRSRSMRESVTWVLLVRKLGAATDAAGCASLSACSSP